MRARNGLCVLAIDVSAEDRSIVATIRFDAVVSGLEKTLFRRHIPVEKWKESLEY